MPIDLWFAFATPRLKWMTRAGGGALISMGALTASMARS